MAHLFQKRRFYFLQIASILLLGACSSTASVETPAQSKQRLESKVETALEKAYQQAYASGDTQKSLALLQEIFKRSQNDPILAARYARGLREDGQLNKARQILTPHAQGPNKHHAALTELAMIYLGLGNYKDAELNARDALTLNPTSGRAFLALGTALDAQSHHQQAEVAFRRGLEYWQGDPASILNNLALNLASQGHLDEAISILQKAKKASPHRLEIERNLRIISTLRESAVPQQSPTALHANQTPPPVPKKKPGQKDSGIVIKGPKDLKIENQPANKKSEPEKEEPQKPAKKSNSNFNKN